MSLVEVVLVYPLLTLVKAGEIWFPNCSPILFFCTPIKHQETRGCQRFSDVFTGYERWLFLFKVLILLIKDNYLGLPLVVALVTQSAAGKKTIRKREVSVYCSCIWPSYYIVGTAPLRRCEGGASWKLLLGDFCLERGKQKKRIPRNGRVAMQWNIWL